MSLTGLWITLERAENGVENPEGDKEAEMYFGTGN